MEGELIRRAYLPSVTLGELFIGSLRLYTLERPWIPNLEGPGGTLSRSCVPDGAYTLRPHDSKNFPRSYALVNESLGVYYQTRPEGQSWGRTAILMHAGNTVADVIGCIAVGMRYALIGGQHSVLESGRAMDQLRGVLGRTDYHRVLIRTTKGTSEPIPV